jgi:hypothetical protein
MRFQAFNGEQPLDRQRVRFPWNPDVYFNIWRSGRREYAGAGTVLQTTQFLDLLRLIARKKGITLKQAREGGVDIQAEIDSLGLDEALGLRGDDASGAAMDLSLIARELVHSVEGPLILADDSDEVLDWHGSEGKHEHLGTAFLEGNPDNFAQWIVAEANRIETEFQTFMAAAAGNLPASSDSSATEEAAVVPC